MYKCTAQGFLAEFAQSCSGFIIEKSYSGWLSFTPDLRRRRGALPITGANHTAEQRRQSSRLDHSRFVAWSVHSDNVWTSLCARIRAARWERQGLCLRGDGRFMFITELGESRSKTRFQSTASARGISVKSWCDLRLHREGRTGHGRPPRRSHLRRNPKNEKESTPGGSKGRSF